MVPPSRPVLNGKPSGYVQPHRFCQRDDGWFPWFWWTMLFSLLLTATASAAECRHVRVLDGDTFVSDIELGFDVVLHQQTIRIHGYDAWESSYRRQTVIFAKDELAKGALAKAALEKLLGSASKVVVQEVAGRDPYGRQLLDVFADGKEVGAILRAQGHERKP
jgi:endonuclease YncB( thermonuclease family)